MLLRCREEAKNIQSTVPWSLPAGCLHSVGPSCSFCYTPPPRSVFLEQATWLSRPYPLPPTDEPNLLAAIVLYSIRLSHTLPKMDRNLTPKSFFWLCGHVSHLNSYLYVTPKDLAPFVQSSNSSTSAQFSLHPLSQYPGDLVCGKTPSVIST